MNETSEISATRDAVVVLTGASSGIGHAAALALAGKGARLVLAARGRTALEAVQAECTGLGAEVLVVPTDVTDARAVDDLAQAAIERFGHIDVWINNVGVGLVGLFDATPMELHRRVIESNLLGHMHGAHAALAHFRLRERGTLINMISVGGIAPAPYAAAYTASKFALRGFSEAIRAEMSGLPKVHVCEVYPTFVDTPGVGHGANHTGHRVVPPPPLTDPREVAAAVVALIEKPRAAVYLGGPSLPVRVAHAMAPQLVGRVTMRLMEKALYRADVTDITDGNLFEPSVGTRIDGGYRRSTSSTWAGLALGAGALLMGWWAMRATRGSARSWQA